MVVASLTLCSDDGAYGLARRDAFFGRWWPSVLCKRQRRLRAVLQYASEYAAW